MATWYHKGRTPFPVDTIDRGSVVIVPRTKFQAHEHAVAHLVKAGVVVRVADAVVAVQAQVAEPTSAAEVASSALFEQPVVKVQEAPPSSEEPQPEEHVEPEVASSGPSSVSDVDSDVVGSSAQVEAEAERVDGESAAPEKKQNRSSKRGRH
jgi:hypothetical protein